MSHRRSHGIWTRGTDVEVGEAGAVGVKGRVVEVGELLPNSADVGHGGGVLSYSSRGGGRGMEAEEEQNGAVAKTLAQDGRDAIAD